MENGAQWRFPIHLQGCGWREICPNGWYVLLNILRFKFCKSQSKNLCNRLCLNLQTQPTNVSATPPPIPRDPPEPDYEVIEFQGQQTYSNTTPPSLPAKSNSG